MWDALKDAAIKGKPETLIFLLEKDNDSEFLNHQDFEGMNLLMHAATNGKHKVVEAMCSMKGIELNLENADNETALMLSAKKGHIIVADLLLKAKANPLNSQNKVFYQSADNSIKIKLREMMQSHKETEKEANKGILESCVIS
jgi:ankyrin repeat protein